MNSNLHFCRISGDHRIGFYISFRFRAFARQFDPESDWLH